MRLTVPANAASARLDRFLAYELPLLSRRRAQQAIASGAVHVNGRRARKGTAVRSGDVVDVLSALSPVAVQPNPDLAVSILYEDASILAVDKPAGMPSHALHGEETATLSNFLLAYDPGLATVSERQREAGLVHRLDTDTSGILLVARTAEAHRALRRQFSAGQVRKEYLALVRGTVTAPARVDTPLVHAGRRMRTADARHSPGARPAHTAIRPLERVGVATLLAIRIRTGVRHQIRIHLASIGHPILGDPVYGDASTAAAAPRQLLHASQLRAEHPLTGRRLALRSPVPPDFAACLQRLR